MAKHGTRGTTDQLSDDEISAEIARLTNLRKERATANLQPKRHAADAAWLAFVAARNAYNDDAKNVTEADPWSPPVDDALIDKLLALKGEKRVGNAGAMAKLVGTDKDTARAALQEMVKRGMASAKSKPGAGGSEYTITK